MRAHQFFFIAAMMLAAPHITWEKAQPIAISCLVLGWLCLGLGAWLARRLERARSTPGAGQ